MENYIDINRVCAESSRDRDCYTKDEIYNFLMGFGYTGISKLNKADLSDLLISELGYSTPRVTYSKKSIVPNAPKRLSRSPIRRRMPRVQPPVGGGSYDPHSQSIGVYSQGCSNKGKYSSSDGPFCGPEGGACDGTYPVGTRAKAIAAKSYARFAPHPEGIKRCANNYARQMGWYDEATNSIRKFK